MQQEEFNYREHILLVSCMLCTVYRELFIYGLNIALCGELKDLKHIFEDGDEYPGDVALLEALEDENIKIILTGMYDIEEHGESVLNLNNISPEELNAGIEEGIGCEYGPEYREGGEMDYHYWMNEVMGYIHLSVFNLLMLCYSLSHGIIEVPDMHAELLYFPTDESLAILDMEDENIKILVDLAFKLSDTANELCEKL